MAALGRVPVADSRRLCWPLLCRMHVTLWPLANFRGLADLLPGMAQPVQVAGERVHNDHQMFEPVEPEAAETVPVDHNQRADFIAVSAFHCLPLRFKFRLLPMTGHPAVDYGQPMLRRAFNPEAIGHLLHLPRSRWHSTCGVT